MLSSVLKFAVILLAAAVLAVGARAMFVARQQPAQAVATPPSDVLVRVAAADLPAGLLLRDGDLDWKPYPRSDVPKGAMQEGSTQAELVGVLLRHRMDEGEPIVATNIIRPDAPGFLAAALKPGMRAVSVPIDDVSGHAGLIQPGDYVDLILTQSLRDNELDNRQTIVVSETVVERARVIAVGTSFQPQQDTSKPARARTVTLEVDPRAAEAVTVASRLGTLSMSLRSFAVEDRNDMAGPDTEYASVVAWDADRDKARPVWGGDVSRALRAQVRGPEEDETQEAAPRKRGVLILRGSDRVEHEFGS